MSRRKKNRKPKAVIVKYKNSKFKTKKTVSKRKLKRKPSSCDENKKPNQTDQKDQKKKSDDSITVERSKLMCRRYEEFHQSFLRYDKILNFLQKTQKCNPGSVDLIKIGNSTQGKPIYMVLITTSFCNSTDPKMAAFLEAGLNGENAIAVSNTLYMIEYLTKNPNFIKIMDYYIIPCCNPDAYDEFIKKKENDANKAKRNCSIGKTKSQKDTSYKNGEETGKSRSKKDKRGSKEHRCDSPSENKTRAKKSHCDSSESNEKDSYWDTPKKDNGKAMKKPRSYRPTDKNGQNMDSDSKTSAKTKCNKDSKKKISTKLCTARGEQNQNSIPVDLTLNFPVVLGLNDMRRIPTDCFLEKIKLWKENYISQHPETRALINAIYTYQFAIKLLISLQEGGEAICYPYGFCAAKNEESDDLKEIAKKGKCGITGRNFEYGCLYDIQGLTYGNLMDFLKVDKSSIKYTYVIKVHKKTPRYSEKEELGQLMRYGCEIMECVKRMSCAVYKHFTDMTGNRKVETESVKRSLDKRSSFE